MRVAETSAMPQECVHSLPRSRFDNRGLGCQSCPPTIPIPRSLSVHQATQRGKQIGLFKVFLGLAQPLQQPFHHIGLMHPHQGKGSTFLLLRSRATMIQNRKTGLTGSQQGQSTESSVSNHRIHVAQALGNHRCDLLPTLRAAPSGFQPSAGFAEEGFKPLRLNRANPL